MRIGFLMRMTSLTLVDLGITGIFIAVSGRLEVLGSDLIANLAVFGLLNVAGAYWMYRPIQAFMTGNEDVDAARNRIRTLPWLASGWAVLCTIVYCMAAFSLGVFMPNTIDLRPVPDGTLMAGLLWFGFVYALYYGFYIFFLVSDFAHGLKLKLFACGVMFHSGGTRIIHKLIFVFVVTAFVPSVLIALDLTLFRPIRAAQGLTVEQTILLDLMASAFLISVSLIFVTRSLVRPIKALTAAMRPLGEGRFGNGAPVISRDELGILAERFNDMLAGLRDREFIRETFG
ncbi:MAG: HAMP domain-containing protein, partial [Rhodospirillales bacterium]|nr:HAMP domain-containing protein [Rhodospirillales bacterium]